MNFLLGTVAYNPHVQNLALALHEAGMLREYHTGGVDVWKTSWSRKLRGFAGQAYPPLEAKLSRRRVDAVPQTLVSTDWRWESYRLAVNQLKLGPLLEDWLWERSEHALDRYCAQAITQSEFDVFMGVEFGALRALTSAKRLGKLGIVAFLSPHHLTRAHWVDAEYERFPELLTPATRKLLEKGKSRDARRDEEAKIADIIHCASRFTRDSLISAGFAADKMILAPLGCPPVLNQPAPIEPRRRIVRFIYSGPASVRKGAHILLDAWKKIRPGATAELHFFGVNTLPPRCLEDLGNGVFFNGTVSSVQIMQEYRDASVLVFPTLCDGFGMVIAEAFANGLPVITTPNAGASDLVQEGKNGWLVPPRDSDALAASMQWCIDHPKVLDQMREPARLTAHHWTWAHFRASFDRQLNTYLRRFMASGKETVANSAHSRS